ncbi:hypothetical protein GCM10010965_25670 [Caldalkalibacillus thermarum]|nr:hypothetical protein GCM10010965_25670 [Caldalkalibacillus thermarum]
MWSELLLFVSLITYLIALKLILKLHKLTSRLAHKMDSTIKALKDEPEVTKTNPMHW